jgi:hypothetical protein
MKKKSISAKEFDERFDRGEDISGYLDMDSVKHYGIETRRISVDFPEWMINMLDREAARLGVTRQSVIKFWISEKLKSA